MKAVVLFFGLILSWSIFAETNLLRPTSYIVGWERPLAEATLEVLEAESDVFEIREVNVELRKRDGSQLPTSIQLDLFGSIQEIGPLTYKHVGCGSMQFTVSQTVMIEGDEFHIELTINDHRARVCKDLRRYRWEAELVLRSGDFSDRLSLGGNPRPIYTIQNAVQPRPTM